MMLDAFQRLTESTLPLFSWYRHILTHPDRMWFLLCAFAIGCVLGLGFKLYREHHLESYPIFDSFPLMLIPVLMGGLLAVLVYLFIVPLFYVALWLVVALIVGDGVEQFHAGVRPIVSWNTVGAFGSFLTLFAGGCLVWFFVAHWSMVMAKWNTDKTIGLGVGVFLLSVFFGLLRHHHYQDRSKLVSSSYLRTTFRYLHINLLWAIWYVFYDFAMIISARNTAGEVALATQENEWVVDSYQVLLDRSAQHAENKQKQIDTLNRQLDGHKNELHRVREENKALVDRVAELGAAVTTLNEQNTELHQQWVDALENQGIVDDGVIDLDELFADEDM